jgi:hypothetical protein
MDISKALLELSQSRKMFHSEADFQFALAWELQKLYPDAKVRLEYCPAGIEPTMHIDILVIKDDEWYPVEMKYKTLGCTKIVDGEAFMIKNHGAQDTGRYDYLKDVQRIEQLSHSLPGFKKGFTVFLTNDPSYWSKSGRSDTVYHEFRLCDNFIKHGTMSWAAHAGEGTTKHRESSIELVNSYRIKWQEFSQIDESRGGRFRYLISKIDI